MDEPDLDKLKNEMAYWVGFNPDVDVTFEDIFKVVRSFQGHSVKARFYDVFGDELFKSFLSPSNSPSSLI